MESVCLGSDPRHLELKVAVLVVVVNQMYADRGDAGCQVKSVSVSTSTQVTADTHILATSFTPSRTVMFATSSFSNSVLATCRPFPTAQARYP